jgi:hypothetical protein
MTVKYTWVRRTWTDYTVDTIPQFHRRIQQDMGWLNRRWGFKIRPMEWDFLNPKEPPMVIDYWFEDPRDATVFALKYLGP